MLVSDIINFAKTGELKQLSIAEVEASDANQAANIEAMISYINLGVIELYKRFGLATQSQTLTEVVNGSSYTMSDDYLYLTYAIGNNTEETEIPINNEFATMSLFEPAPYQIFVTKDDVLHADITEVYITYQATPVLLTATTDSVALPYQFIEALLLYMAVRAHSALSGLPNEENNTFYQRFEASCARITKNGMFTADNQSNYKHWMRGYA